MLSVTAATALLLENAVDFNTETVHLTEAVGRVLAEPLIADRDFPPFDRVTMDGIAIDYQAFAQGKRNFFVEGLQAAGAPQLTLQEPTHCLEVMTGAMLPAGTDTVIRYEDVIIEENIAKIQVKDVIKGQNIHRKGNDRQKYNIILNNNVIISPAELGVAATVGKAQVLVKKLPRVAIISTGDEIVEVTEIPLAHQIRSSNAYALQGLLAKWSIRAERIHLFDNEELIINELKKYLLEFDVLLLSGGVSEGKLDYVPKALKMLGVQQVFHKVQQRPGKPLWFGKLPSGATVFALPGNPVSALMCAVRYVEPWLRKSLGLAPIVEKFAILTEDILFKPDLTYFLQVQLQYNEQGQILAKPLAGGGSGDLANLVETDGFLELPNGKNWYEKGEVFRFWRYWGG